MAGACFFSIKEIEKKNEKNELLVYRLFAQVSSAKLPQRILLVLWTILILNASASVVHSNFRAIGKIF